MEEQTIEEQVCEMCPTMTFKQRLIARPICCCVLGYILDTDLWHARVDWRRRRRGTSASSRCCTCAAILIDIMATAFWVGPKLMCKKMWNSTQARQRARLPRGAHRGLVLAADVAVFVVLLMLAVGTTSTLALRR